MDVEKLSMHTYCLQLWLFIMLKHVTCVEVLVFKNINTRASLLTQYVNIRGIHQNINIKSSPNDVWPILPRPMCTCLMETPDRIY